MTNEIDEKLLEILDKYFPKGDKRRGDALVLFTYCQLSMQNSIEKNVLAEKIDKIWNNRRFVTGNIISQQREEEAYVRGWINCFNKIKKELLGTEEEKDV